MEVEAIRLIADQLADPTNGVNALLAGVPRYAGHTLPPNVTIYNEIERAELARRAVAKDAALTYPALFVYEHGDASIEGHVQTDEQDCSIDVAICYAVKKSDTAKGSQDARYTMRAVRRSLVRLNDASEKDTGTSCWFIDIERLRRLTLHADMEDAIVTLTLVATINLRDDAPRG